ncbi:MAG: hypothetical protein A2639_01450 [Candidatus Staskawiczbacteria bacterium RIFCSPHIGHO2_01_FULL_34_27]|uniref:Uncharacterized protein n=1 Tax=Candidatus Staskawiczbacteria bacterium RIFCSPHIGHO2_01_FULL_34_27 TaxID=1802199 RepID=A0A1G2HKC5_9BACT|nr:MAG: hypothetical protein A2639_01450 [Candidatus Staskawiczbacteria bacterium RIFCSPHIGHO2_01_FULL_34_27]
MQSKTISVNYFKINWKAVYFLGIIFFLIMLISYVFLVNQLTGGIYTVKSYDKEISALLEENKRLENSFAQTSFLGSVQVRAQGFSFEKTTQVKYINILDSSLAKAK